MISFREKSLWVSLLISLVIASVYGDNILAFLAAGEAVSGQDISGLIFRVVIAFIVLEVVLHIALAMKEQEGSGLPEDERERNYRLLANNVGYWVLSIGVIACISQQMINSSFGFAVQNEYTNLALAPFELKLVVIFWLSEVARFATELYYYRQES